jgi:hypothetical protein
MVQPAQAPLPDCVGCPEPLFEMNRDVYETDADFPADVVKILEVDTYMGIPVAIIQVRPMQFNPVAKTKKVYSKIKFKVTFGGARGSFESGTPSASTAKNPIDRREKTVDRRQDPGYRRK